MQCLIGRYLAICHSIWCKKYRNLQSAIVVSSIGWLVIVVLMTPIYIYSGVVALDGNVSICSLIWPNSTVQPNETEPSVQTYFSYYSFATCFALPAVVIIFFYCKIVLEMVRAEKRQSRLRRKKTDTYKKVIFEFF